MLNFLSASGFSKLITLECEDTIDVELSKLIETDYLTPRNLLKPSVISVSGTGNPELMINDNNIWSRVGTILPGQRIKIRAYSSPLYSTITVTTISINNITFTWKLKTRKALVTPTYFSFQPRTNVELNEIVYSEYIIVSGFEIPVPISIVGNYSPKISINNGVFVTNGMVRSGETIRVKLNSANAFSTVSFAALTISDYSTNFIAITRNQVKSPIPFYFTNINNAGLAALFESDIIVPIGFDSPINISISNGEYCINNDNIWKSQDSIFLAGQSIKLRATSQNEMGKIKVITLNIGNFTTHWQITTGILTGNPDNFELTPIIDVEPRTMVSSEPILITGLPQDGAIVSVTNNDNMQFLISSETEYSVIPKVIYTGESIVVKLLSSIEYNKKTSGFLTIGGISSEFQIKTKSADNSIVSISFDSKIDVEPGKYIESDAVRILGIDTELPIAIYGNDSPQFQIDGGDWINSGVISNNQLLKLRVMSSVLPLIKTTATIVIDNLIVCDFYITTREQNITPDNIEFIPVNNVPLQTNVESNVVIISGIDTLAPISIINGLYKINSNAYTYENGTIGNGDRLQIMVNSASTTNTNSSAIVKIGNMVKIFSTLTIIDVICDSYQLVPNTNQIDSYQLIESNKIRITGFDTILNVYIQSQSSNNFDMQVSITDDPVAPEIWKSPISNNSPISSIQSGQYLAVRAISPDYSVNLINISYRTGILRIGTTPTTGVTGIYQLTTSTLANSTIVYGNTIYIPNSEAAFDVYYYSDLLMIRCVGDINTLPNVLFKSYMQIEPSRDFLRNFIQVSLDNGLTWSDILINHSSPFKYYVNHLDEIRIRCKIPSDYSTLPDYANNGTALMIHVKLWTVPESQTTNTLPTSQLLAISIPSF